MSGRRASGPVLLALAVLLSFWLAGCGGSAPPAAGPERTVLPVQDLQAQAAAEATAIIQQAQATALVLQAQAQATALIQGAKAQGGEPASAAARTLPAVLPTPSQAGEEPTPLPVDQNPETTAGAVSTATVELLGVGFGAEGAFLIANYKAPPVVAQAFWPGVLSITDEASGTVFNEVPLMPLIGPLIARPVENGQPGYFMVVHAPAILRPGSLVTVKLADYTFEHVPVQ